jgi:hypothetical protein
MERQMTKEQSRFLIELEQIDKRLADYAQERFSHGVTLEAVKKTFLRSATAAGRK